MAIRFLRMLLEQTALRVVLLQLAEQPLTTDLPYLQHGIYIEMSLYNSSVGDQCNLCLMSVKGCAKLSTIAIPVFEF